MPHEKQLQRLVLALLRFASPYDGRLGRSQPRCWVKVHAEDGQQVGAPEGVGIPLSALDDLIMALQDVRTRRIREYEQIGWAHQASADYWLKHPELFPAKPTRDDVRGWYEQAAAKCHEADDVSLLLDEE